MPARDIITYVGPGPAGLSELEQWKHKIKTPCTFLYTTKHKHKFKTQSCHKHKTQNLCVHDAARDVVTYLGLGPELYFNCIVEL